MDLVRILICGGRHFEEYDFFETCIDNFLDQHDFNNNDIEIVSGGCAGTDRLAERFAQEHGCAIKVFPADWEQYGKAAGPIRNKQMIEYIAQVTQKFVIAFTSVNSKGTLGTIKMANKAGIPVVQIDYEITDFTNSLYEGVLYNPDTEEFDFNWFKDAPEDIIHLTQTKIGSTKFKKRMYYFGYKINTNEEVDKQHKKLFLQYLKTEAGSDSRITEMITRCVEHFYEASKIKNFDYIAKLPSRAKINTLIADIIKNQFDNPKEIELVKKSSEELVFDWDKFKTKFKGDEEYFKNFYIWMNNYINSIKKDPYFSISKLSPKYRQYLKPMITFGKDSVENNQDTNLLIVDDTLSSGSTLTMVLSLLEEINFKGTVTILTLINNKY